MLFGANAGVFRADPFSWFDFVTSYLMIPIFVSLYVIHKLWHRTRVVPLQDCEL